MNRSGNRPGVVGQPIAQQQIRYGFDQLTTLLAHTLGPAGGAVANFQEGRNKVELLDNSATTVRRILGLGSPQRDIGAMIVRGLVWQVGERAGDGGATAAVLAQSLYHEGLRLLAAGYNPAILERGIRRALQIALKALHEQARTVVTEDELAGVARTAIGGSSAGGDNLAAVLGEMAYLLGPDSHLVVEKYVAPYLQRSYVAGARYKAKISSMYFYSEGLYKRAVLATPAVALVNEALKRADQVVPLLEAALAQKTKTLLLVAHSVSDEALNVLVANQQREKKEKQLDILAVKLNAIGDQRAWAWQDLALLTGATVLGGEAGYRPERARADHLGRAQRAEFGGDALVLLSTPQKRDVVQQELASLRHRLDRTPLNDDDHPKLVERLSTLTGGVGVLKVGAHSKLEREQLQDVAERTWKVLSAAQKGGVVAGGGAALRHCATALEAAIERGEVDDVELPGARLVVPMLAAPLLQILGNAGVGSPASEAQRIADAGAPATYDVLRHQRVDGVEAGLLDVVDVLERVLHIATSSAITALTTDTIVYRRQPGQSTTPV